LQVGLVSAQSLQLIKLKAVSATIGEKSRCTANCGACKKSDRFVITHQSNDNKPKFYLGVTLGMHHESKSNPLECSSEISKRGVQKMEALLWSLDRLNANSSFQISSVVMDSCGSKMRTSRDTALLLEQKDEFQADKIITMITADGAAVAESTTNLAAPFSIPVISSEAPYHKQHSPFPLQLNAGLKMRIHTILRLITKLGWDSISVITSEEGSESEAMMKLAQFEAKKLSVSVMNAVYLPDIRDDLAGEIFMNTLLETRNVARESGVRAVLLLLPKKQLEQLFTASRTLHQDGEVVPGELVYLGIQHDDIFQKYRLVSCDLFPSFIIINFCIYLQ
jgi:Receptor family ligand binding region